MDSLQLIIRGLNAVSTVGQARVAIGEALVAIGRAHKLPGLTAANRAALEARRIPLQAWYMEQQFADAPANRPYKAEFAARRRLVEGAYIEIAGVGGELDARKSVSFGSELARAAQEAPVLIGRAVGKAAAGVGETAGQLVGGLLSGLGSLVVLVIAVAVYFAYFAPKRGAAS